MSTEIYLHLNILFLAANKQNISVGECCTYVEMQNELSWADFFFFFLEWSQGWGASNYTFLYIKSVGLFKLTGLLRMKQSSTYNFECFYLVFFFFYIFIFSSFFCLPPLHLLILLRLFILMLRLIFFISFNPYHSIFFLFVAFCFFYFFYIQNYF